jgi:hypothetical protein
MHLIPTLLAHLTALILVVLVATPWTAPCKTSSLNAPMTTEASTQDLASSTKLSEDAAVPVLMSTVTPICPIGFVQRRRFTGRAERQCLASTVLRI